MIVSLYSMAAFCSRCRAAAKVLAEKKKRNSVHSAPLAVQLAPLIFRTTALIKLFDTHHSLSI